MLFPCFLQEIHIQKGHVAKLKGEEDVFQLEVMSTVQHNYSRSKSVSYPRRSELESYLNCLLTEVERE